MLILGPYDIKLLLYKQVNRFFRSYRPIDSKKINTIKMSTAAPNSEASYYNDDLIKMGSVFVPIQASPEEEGFRRSKWAQIKCNYRCRVTWAGLFLLFCSDEVTFN